MRLTPLTALLLLACSTSTPTTSPGGSTPTSVGTSAEALRKQRQIDADDVERCRDVAARCAESEDDAADGGAGRGCERLNNLCDELEERLASDRADLEQCLEEAAACEAAATDPAECEDERAACEPADRDLRGRRDRTLECSDRAKQCFGRGRGRGGQDEADAGASVCEAGDEDFIGCCEGKRGRRGDRGDAGVDGNDGRPGFGFRPGNDNGNGPFGRGGDDSDGDDSDGDDRSDSDGDDAADAGRPRRRF